MPAKRQVLFYSERPNIAFLTLSLPLTSYVVN